MPFLVPGSSLAVALWILTKKPMIIKYLSRIILLISKKYTFPFVFKINFFCITQAESVQLKEEAVRVPVQSVEEICSLKEANAGLEASLAEAHAKMETLRDDLKNEYQSYVDQLRKQVESLVDQINRMSDEREDAFAKIDRLEALLGNANRTSHDLQCDVDRLRKQVDSSSNSGGVVDQSSSASQQSKSGGGGGGQKFELLENEIKYFKQQIELLLIEESNYKQVKKKNRKLYLFSILNE